MIGRDDANQIIQMLAQGLASAKVADDQKEYVLLDISNDIQGEGSSEKYYTVGPLIITSDYDKAKRLRAKIREIINEELEVNKK
ncbi:MAG: hypothetical protein ACE5JV_03460 [Nitrososphaerales archaeon]